MVGKRRAWARNSLQLAATSSQDFRTLRVASATHSCDNRRYSSARIKREQNNIDNKIVSFCLETSYHQCKLAGSVKGKGNTGRAGSR